MTSASRDREDSFTLPAAAGSVVLTKLRSPPVTADDSGSFRLQVLIFHRDFLGPRAVTASPPDDPSATYTEPAEMLVVPGRGSPPAFVPADGLTFEPDTLIIIRR